MAEHGKSGISLPDQCLTGREHEASETGDEEARRDDEDECGDEQDDRGDDAGSLALRSRPSMAPAAASTPYRQAA
jgi:hypothetical protein